MEEEEDTSSPFWLPSTSQASRTRRRRRSSSSSLFNSGVLLIFLLAIAVAFFFFIVVPSIRSLTSQVFKPQTVKRSWDSLNLVLVLFAIICGFLSRNSNNGGNHESTAAATTSSEDYKFGNRSESPPKSNPETPRRFWYDHSYNVNSSNNGGLSKFRNFSSHPDLRQEEALWVNRDDQWRFYDDTILYNNRFSSLDHQWQPKQEEEEKKEIEKVDHVDSVKNVDANLERESRSRERKQRREPSERRDRSCEIGI